MATQQRSKVRVTSGRIEYIRLRYDLWDPKEKSFETLLEELKNQTGIWSYGVIKVIIDVYAQNFYRRPGAKRHRIFLTDDMKKVLAGFDSELSPVAMTYLFNFYFEDSYITPICPRLIIEYRERKLP